MAERKIIVHISDNGDMNLEVVGTVTLIEHIGIHKFYCELFTSQMVGNSAPAAPQMRFEVVDNSNATDKTDNTQHRMTKENLSFKGATTDIDED